MNNYMPIRIGFLAAAVYEGVLGVIFTFMPLTAFARFGVTPPNHPGYVQFPALLLIIFTLMFLAVARNPGEYRCLIPYGILLKAAYSGLVFFYWFTTGVPGLWKPFAVIDFFCIPPFAWAYIHLGRKGGETIPGA